MKKSIRNILAGLLISVTMSNIITIDAAIYAPSEHFSNIKNFLLRGNNVNEINNYNYDVNKDWKRNVLDLCRMKRYALNNADNTILDTISIKAAYFSLENPSTDNTNMKVTIPVRIVNNSNSIDSFKFCINYDQNSFILSGANGGMINSKLQYSVSGNTINCWASSPVTESSIVLNLEFSMKNDIKNGTYTFSISQPEVRDKYGILGSERFSSESSEKRVSISGVQNLFPSDISDPTADSSKMQIFNWMNSERSKSNLQALKLDKNLSYVADIRAKELDVKYDGKTRPDGSSYKTLLSEYGMLRTRCIQMLSDDSSASGYINTMMDYRSKIVDAQVVYAGIGHYASGGKNYWVVYLVS